MKTYFYRHNKREAETSYHQILLLLIHNNWLGFLPMPILTFLSDLLYKVVCGEIHRAGDTIPQLVTMLTAGGHQEKSEFKLKAMAVIFRVA
jgi:hypothetical protein